MTTPMPSDPNLSSKTQLASSSKTANLKDLTFEDWHRRLLKDVPLQPEREGLAFCVKVSGPCPVSIRVGRTHFIGPEFDDPVGYLLYMARRQQFHYPEDDLRVVAEFLPQHWTLEGGFYRLGEFLACLGQMEVPFERWGRLDILLPDLELPYDIMSPPLLPFDSFLNLRRLTWRGHRKQLLVSWLPFTPNLLRTLTILEIQCDISLHDCYYMLYHGENLVEFTIRIIQRDLASEKVLNFFAPPLGCVTRPLEYMCLVSDDDITLLLRLFDFPSLRQIHFTLGHPTYSTFSEWRIWKTLKRLFLKAYISEDDISWITSQCDDAVISRFAHAGECTRGASSFVHNEHNGFSNAPFFKKFRYGEEDAHYKKVKTVCIAARK